MVSEPINIKIKAKVIHLCFFLKTKIKIEKCPEVSKEIIYNKHRTIINRNGLQPV